LSWISLGNISSSFAWGFFARLSTGRELVTLSFSHGVKDASRGTKLPDFSWKWFLKHALQLFSSLEAVPKNLYLGPSSLQKATQTWCVVMGGDWRNGLKRWHLSPWSSCAAIFRAGTVVSCVARRWANFAGSHFTRQPKYFRETFYTMLNTIIGMYTCKKKWIRSQRKQVTLVRRKDWIQSVRLDSARLVNISENALDVYCTV
jgi:hypothetical protein